MSTLRGNTLATELSLAQLDSRYRQQPPLPSGTYLFTASEGVVSTSATLGTGNLRVYPWLLTQTLSITRIGAEITTAGDVGSKLRVGIYGDTGTCYPGSLIVDAGQIAGDSATVQELTITQTLASGLYWIAGVVQAVTTTSPTVRTLSNWTPPLLIPAGTTLPTAGSTIYGYATGAGAVTGALPATFAAAQAVHGNSARVFVKTA